MRACERVSEMINVCVCVYLVHIHLDVTQPVSLCVCITSLGISLERYKRCVQLPCCRAPPLPRSAGNLTSLTLIPHFNKRVYGSQDLVSPPYLLPSFLLTSPPSPFLIQWFITARPLHHRTSPAFGAVNLDLNKAFL